LVHCFAGMSRSVTIVSAYLMKKYSMGAIEALKYVLSKREQSNPNAGFILQLIKYQQILNIPYDTSTNLNTNINNTTTEEKKSIENHGQDTVLKDSRADPQNILPLARPIVVMQHPTEIETEQQQERQQLTARDSNSRVEVELDIEAETKTNQMTSDNHDDTNTKLPDNNKETAHIARLSINSKTLKAWEKGKRPSLFTAIEKLKRLRSNAHNRNESSGHTPSNSMSLSVKTDEEEDGGRELSVSSLLQDNNHLHFPDASPSSTPLSTPIVVGDLSRLQGLPNE